MCMVRNSPRGSWEIPEVSTSSDVDRLEKARCHNANMHASGKSDSLVVPEKRANDAGQPTAEESVEERGLTKKNGKQPLMVRTQCRVKHVARTVWRTSGGRNWSRRLGPNATRLVNIQGRSLTAKMGTGTADGASPRFRRMRSFRTYGSVRGRSAMAVPTAILVVIESAKLNPFRVPRVDSDRSRISGVTHRMSSRACP